VKGQGIIEAVYSIGVLGMILTGAIILIIMSATSKKNDFDRKKAVEMGNIVIEELIASSRDNQNIFWELNNVSGVTKSGYDGYSYSVEYTNISANSDYPNCGVGVTNCAEAKVVVNWQGKNPQSMTFNRFFTKNGY
jgi:hypothetical protein